MSLPYLYQTIHTRNYKARHLAEHCELLERCFWRLFSRRVVLSYESLSGEIEALLRDKGVAKNLSTHVELRVMSDGSYSLQVTHNSIYEGYTLRCFNPFAVCQTYSVAWGEYPSSVRRATEEWAQAMAQTAGGDVVIRVGTDGVVYSCCDAPLFGVKGGKVFSSPSTNSVERNIATAAIFRAGYEFSEQAIMKRHLPMLDELFYVDAFGVTAIAQVGNRRYMSVVAEKISKKME